MVGATFVAAIAIAALPLLTSQAPQGSVGLSAWPHNEGRLFDLPSREAWDRVQARLKDLGLHTDKKDDNAQLLLTRWADFGDDGLRWLPGPKVLKEYAPERVRLEVFVSPFVEPPASTSDP